MCVCIYIYTYILTHTDIYIDREGVCELFMLLYTCFVHLSADLVDFGIASSFVHLFTDL